MSGPLTNRKGAELKEQVINIKNKGNKCLQGKDEFGALRCYKEAISLAETSSVDLHKELAVLHTNCSTVGVKLGLYKDALADAEKAVGYDKTYFKGYWKQGHCHKFLKDEKSALVVYIMALKNATMSESDKVSFLVAIVELLPLLKQKDETYTDELKDTIDIFNDHLPKVLAKLLESKLFEPLRFLFLGLNQTLLRPSDGPGLIEKYTAINAGLFKATGVDLEPFLSLTEYEWMGDLVVVLMVCGARCDSLTSSQRDTPLHAAIEFCVKSGRTVLIEYILQKQILPDEAKILRDVKGQTLLHTICECCPTGESKVGVQLTDLLLKLSFNPNEKNYDNKLATEMVPEKSTLHNMLKRAENDFVQLNVNRLKEEGNVYYKRENFSNAIKKYTGAIDLMNKTTGDPHMLAILHGNRAECYLKMKRPKEALKDSISSLQHDDGWHRAHWRLAKSYRDLMRNKEAAREYVATWNCLISSSNYDSKDEILSDLLGCVTKIDKVDQETIFHKMLDVQASMLVKVTYSSIRKGIWVSAEVAYSWLLKVKWEPTTFKYDLRPLCNSDLLNFFPWVVEFMCLLLSVGSDHRSLSFSKGDTYLHAGFLTLVYSGRVDVFDWLTETVSVPRKDMNLQDVYGYTLLHLAAYITCSPDIKMRWIYLILSKGTDPNIRSLQGTTVEDIARECDPQIMFHLRQALDQVHHGFTPASTTNPVHAPLKSNISKGRDTRKPVKKKGHAQQDIHDCSKCENDFCKGKLFLTNNDVSPAVEIFVSILRSKGSGRRHSELVGESMDKIAEFLCKSSFKEVPLCLKDIQRNQMQKILERIAKNGKWTKFGDAVDYFGKVNLGKNFAKYISVAHLLMSSEASESQKMKLMALLQNHGANISREKNKEEALQSVFIKEEFLVVYCLIERGISPSLISHTSGDRPLHASLMVALMKGEFDILKKLLHLHSTDKRKYHYLDPKSVDVQGDTLLHVACKHEYSKHSLRAVEHLCNQQVPADAVNKEGKRPIEYLPDRNDRRAQYLRVVGGTAPSTSQANQQDEDNIPEMTHLKVEETRSKKGRKIVSQKQDTAIFRLKEKVKKMILERPDARNIFHEKEKEKFQTTPVLKVKKEKEPSKQHTTVGSEVCLDNAYSSQSTLDGNDEETSKKLLNLSTKEFVDLTWEVDCTSDVIQFLLGTKVPLKLKHEAIVKIHQLAKGKWKEDQYSRLGNTQSTVQLFETNLGKDGKMIWEIGVAFSSRCSEDPEKRLSNEEHTFIVKQGRIYSEIIRIWSISFGSNESTSEMVNKIMLSHTKGKECLFTKKLVCQGQQEMSKRSYRVPVLFTEADGNSKGRHLDVQFYPPASPNKTEFNIIKFYSFSAAMVKSVLRKTDHEIELPFRVTDTEQAIIQLRSDAPILLLGRSGTGKTTCCMFRLWTNFISYWNEARDLGEPFLPRRDLFEEDQENEQNADDTSDANDECENAASGTNVKTERADDVGIAPQSEEQPTEEKISILVTSVTELSEEIDITCLEDVEETEVKAEETDVVASDEEAEDEDGDCTGPVYDHLHQIFVTKNPVLCAEVHKNFYQLCNVYEDLIDHIENESVDILPRLQDVEDLSYPLFLTSKQLLLMLDASLEPPHFFERNEDGSLSVKVQGWGSDDLLTDLYLFSSESDDESMDHENQEENLPFQEERDMQQNHNTTNQQRVDPRREVTYDIFVDEIYPRIIKNHSALYHPSLVWTEIMSFIKGSFEALNKSEGHLSREEYKEMGRKRAPNFSGERDIVYELYVRYAHYKRNHFFFDEADLVQNVNKRIKGLQEKPWVIHQLYVDETQDFTQSELFLFIRLIQHPNDLFLTGDTAQGIMRGISFRFPDLKSLFFHARSLLHPVGQTTAIGVPKQIYQLTHNYRSHAGILTLATAILDILVEFFPESFDRMEPDQGLFMGPKPILLESCSHGDLAVLMQGNKRKTSHIEFGAHQAILVVNKSVKSSMPENLSHGIVLTIYEAKGLEFDDVLLYNFFKDSQVTKEWRVVTTFLQRLLDASQKRNGSDNSLKSVQISEEVLKQPEASRPLKFDSSQHKLLNSELKHLYTALTRARVNVWIFDEDETKRAPMFEYFKARNLVRCITEKDIEDGALEDTVFAEMSTTDDWLRRAEEMMGRKLYEVAAKCYKMGQDLDMEKKALAYHQALKATRCQDDPQQSKDEFFVAAEKFLDSSEDRKAAYCLQNARAFELAGLLYEKTGMLLKAAKMYHACNKPFDESRCMEQLGHFHTAVDVLAKAELYEQAIDCLNRYKLLTKDMTRKGKDMPETLEKHKPGKQFTVERLTYKAANYYKRDNKEKMMEALERLPRVEDRIEFLKSTPYVDDAADLMVKEGKASEAVQYLLQHGKAQEALSLAERVNEQTILGNCHFALALKIWHDAESSRDDVISALHQAYNAYTTGRNKNRMGICKLTQAILTQSKEDARTALLCFRDLKPFANEAGMIEALDVIVKADEVTNSPEFKDIRVLIQGVDALFNVMEALLKFVSGNTKARSQLYLELYGLYKKEADMLMVYPKEHPLCAKVIPGFFTSSEEQCQTVERNRRETCILLSSHLVEMLNCWTYFIKHHIEAFITAHQLCILFIQGRKCLDKSCPFLHTYYTDETSFAALEALVWNVKFDKVLQNGIKCMKDLQIRDVNLKKLYRKINVPQREHMWNSSEALLNFLVPEDHQRISIRSTNSKVCNLLVHGHVPEQIKEYLVHYWGTESEGSFAGLLQERSKNTDWFLRALVFVPLFKVNIDIVKIYEDLEREVALNQPDWLFKRKTGYALFVEIDKESVYVESLGRKLHDVYLWLQESPVKAVIEFAKCVRFLCSKNTFSLFPRISMFLHWTELFICITFQIISRLSAVQSKFVIPASYLAKVPFFNSTFSKQNIGIEELIHRSKKKKENIRVMKGCTYNICEILYGQKLNLLKRLFSPKNNSEIKYLQAERCFVLALTLCTNQETFITKRMKSDLMLVLSHLELPSDAPERFVKVLEAVKLAKDTRDTSRALNEFILARGEDGLFICQWDNKERKHVKTQKLENTDAEVLSEIFERHSDQQEVAQEEAEVSEAKQEEDEEFSLTEEEKEKRLQEDVKRERGAAEDKSARTLQRFFKWLTMKGRLEHTQTLFNRCRRQQLKEFQITATVCGVCGVKLHCIDSAKHVENNPSTVPKQEYDQVSAEYPESPISGTEMSENRPTLKEHESTREHTELMLQFESFRLLYESSFVKDICQMRLFIKKHKLKDEGFVKITYTDLGLEVPRLVRQMKDLSKLLESLLDNRQWNQTEELQITFTTLKDDYLKIKQDIEAIFKVMELGAPKVESAEPDSHPRDEDVEEEEDMFGPIAGPAAAPPPATPQRAGEQAKGGHGGRRNPKGQKRPKHTRDYDRENPAPRHHKLTRDKDFEQRRQRAGKRYEYNKNKVQY